MIPQTMKQFLEQSLPETLWKNRLRQENGLAFLEFGPLDVDRLQRLGIRVDRLGPRLVVCMWDEKSPLEIGGYLVVDNLAMGSPSMGGTRMLPHLTPDIIHNLARGMTLKNAAADLPFGGGKSGIVCPEDLSEKDRPKIIKGFARLLNRYKAVYIPGPDVGTNDADMKRFAVENGLNKVVSKPVDMGGNRIDELGGAAFGVTVAFQSLLEHLPRLKCLPQFRDMEIPEPARQDILIQGFGAVGAHVARIFHQDYAPPGPIIKGISDAQGYLLCPDGLPWETLFAMWKKFHVVTRKFFQESMMTHPESPDLVFSSNPDNLLRESAFCLIPASPIFNYLDVDESSGPSMTTDRMGNWRLIVEGANTYSPDPARKAARRRMERKVFRDRGTLIATDYLVNSGGVIYAAHERIIPTPDPLLIPEEKLGHPRAVEDWLTQNRDAFSILAETRRKAAARKLKTVIQRNMKELVDGLCRDADSLPCEIAEKISIQRIACREKARTVRDIMKEAPAIGLDRRIADAAKLLVNEAASMVHVVSEKGKLIGIVTSWDIARGMAGRLPMDAPLTRVMTADVVTIGPDALIIDCIRMLENHEISAMPVVEDDRVLGVISGDILARQTLLRLLQTVDPGEP